MAPKLSRGERERKETHRQGENGGTTTRRRPKVWLAHTSAWVFLTRTLKFVAARQRVGCDWVESAPSLASSTVMTHPLPLSLSLSSLLLLIT